MRMNKTALVKRLAAGAAGLVLASNIVMATPASAYPAGGGEFWSWYSDTRVWANYYHPTITHSVTACGMGFCATDLQRWGITAKVDKFGFWGKQAWWNTYGGSYY